MNGPCPGDGRTRQSSESVVSFDSLSHALHMRIANHLITVLVNSTALFGSGQGPSSHISYQGKSPSHHDINSACRTANSGCLRLATSSFGAGWHPCPTCCCIVLCTAFIIVNGERHSSLSFCHHLHPLTYRNVSELEQKKRQSMH